MSNVVEQVDDRTVVAGRAFVRMSPEGRIDGGLQRGIYADDLRLARRVQGFRAGPETPVNGAVAIAEDAATVRFEFVGVEAGTGVMVVVELDGTDMFTVRELQLDEVDTDTSAQGLRLGEARPDARVRLEAHCDGAKLVDRDGVAQSPTPIPIDGTARTASWRWDVPADAPGPVDVVIEVRMGWTLSSGAEASLTRPFAELNAERRRTVDQWLAERPRFEGPADLERVVRYSLRDLASLRIPTEDGDVLAAGVPWYLTVFGRDALLASWMALPVSPNLAASTLRYLARHQARDYDLATDAQPGKILHEERRGVAATRWHERYYGSVDATPLFVMLLAELTRWTASDRLASELELPARAAIAWIQSRVDEDELGLLSYWRRAERGLDVQSWKDSSDSQRDHLGRVASGLMRPLEAQGYAVAALRAASRLASTVWDDAVIASEWAATARQLERRLADRCTVELPPSQLDGDSDPRRGGFLAQSLDAQGLPVDSLCSNAGHVLWAEAIADPTLRTAVIEQLAHPALDSGWGIRTMSTFDGGYDPRSYHRGSVWPHDTALCIAGIARYDRATAARIARGLLDAAVACGGRLPEHFAGYPRSERDERPDELPDSCSPQAWAAAAPLLVLRSLLGLEPDINGQQLVATTTEVPEWLAGAQWRGLFALGGRWDVSVGRDCLVEVHRVS